MWTLIEPSPHTVRALLAAQRHSPFLYAPVGGSDGPPPRGFDLDHNRVMLGHGRHVFRAACAAIRDWQMLPGGWMRIHPARPRLEVGQIVVLEIRLGCLRWLNAARVVKVFDEPYPVRRIGFAYGTLTDHAESGEERFSVELDDEGQVWYDLRAFSRPRHVLARLGYPIVRRLQRRFVRESLAAMQRATSHIADW